MGTTTPTKPGFFTETSYIGNRSSNIENIAYDEISGNLYIEFWSGNTAAYTGVDLDTYYNFITVESAGKFYNSHVKGKFQGISFPNPLTLRDETKPALTVVPTSPAPVQIDPANTFYVDVLVTQTLTIEAANSEEALREAARVGTPVRIAWDV